MAKVLDMRQAKRRVPNVPPRSPSYRMANTLTGGKLVEVLIEGRAAGDSFQALSDRLRDEYGVVATDQTLIVWHKTLAAEAAIEAEETEAVS